MNEGSSSYGIMNQAIGDVCDKGQHFDFDDEEEELTT